MKDDKSSGTELAEIVDAENISPQAIAEILENIGLESKRLLAGVNKNSPQNNGVDVFVIGLESVGLVAVTHAFPRITGLLIATTEHPSLEVLGLSSSDVGLSIYDTPTLSRLFFLKSTRLMEEFISEDAPQKKPPFEGVRKKKKGQSRDVGRKVSQQNLKNRNSFNYYS